MSNLINNNENILSQYNPDLFTWREYIVSKTIGKGADGTVVKLQNQHSKHQIAAKVSTNRNNFNEINILKKTDHENIIKMLGYEFTVNQRIIYLEYVEGITLESLIMKYNGIEMSELFPIYYQIFNGITYLHSVHIAHMDIKPDNILLDKCKSVKIIDFENCLDFSKIPSVRGPIGSLAFGAPEINLNRFYHGFPCDTFSLHLTLATSATGRLLWSQAHDSDSKYKNWISNEHMTKEFSDLNIELFQFLKRVLIHDPTRRPAMKHIKDDCWFVKMKSEYIKECL